MGMTELAEVEAVEERGEKAEKLELPKAEGEGRRKKGVDIRD